ncbi:MAG: hypothetical protein JWR37_1156, partial [Mycobacterium sp.]|nr:hypothetical protein [Mycobacterium sp.]
MRALRSVLVATLVGGATGLVGATAAHAATPAPLYVDNIAGANCSDAGTGTQTQPYCTVATAMGALKANGTVNIAGAYTEHVTVPVSGVTIQAYPSVKVATFSGATAGLTIDGLHDVIVTGMSMNIGGTAVTTDPVVSVNNSVRITIQKGIYSSNSSSATVRLTGVTDSSVLSTKMVNSYGRALTLDAATTGVLVKSGLVNASNTPTSARADGIDIAGSH